VYTLWSIFPLSPWAEGIIIILQQATPLWGSRRGHTGGALVKAANVVGILTAGSLVFLIKF